MPWEFLLTLVAVLLADVILAIAIWFLVNIFWNNLVQKKLQVRSDKAWAYLLLSVVLLINAVVIVLQRQALYH